MADSDEDLDISIHDIGNAPELPTQHRHRRSLGGTDSFVANSSQGSRTAGGLRYSLSSDHSHSNSMNLSPTRRTQTSPRPWNRMRSSSSGEDNNHNQNHRHHSSSSGMRPRVQSTGGILEESGHSSSGNNSNNNSHGNIRRPRLWSSGSASSSSIAPPPPPALRLNHVESFPPEGSLSGVMGHHSGRSATSHSSGHFNNSNNSASNNNNSNHNSNKRVAFAQPSPRSSKRALKAETGLQHLPEDEPSEVDYGYETPSFEYHNRSRSESYGDASRNSESIFSDGTMGEDDEDEEGTMHTANYNARDTSGSNNNNNHIEIDEVPMVVADDVNRVVLCGYLLPEWMTNRPSWNRVAAIVVTRSPCFWYCFSKLPTDREILARLNILSSFVGIIQVAAVLWLIVVSFSANLTDRNLVNSGPVEDEVVSLNTTIPESNDTSGIEILLNFWSLNGAIYVLGFLAFIICTSATLTYRVIRNVNLVGAIRYLWVLLWIAPFEILFVIGLFDYFRVTDVWIKHWWRDSTLAWFRKQFCNPTDTMNTLCTVPILGEAEEALWCMSLYNSTECSGIRNAAQSDMERFMLTYYWLNAGVGLLMICLLFLNIMTLEGIVSRPLVQKSRESNVPAWFALPIVGSIAIGIVYGFAGSSGLNTETETEASFIGPMYIAIGALFLFIALLGWTISSYSILNTRDKQAKLFLISVFIAGSTIAGVLLAVVFSSSIAFTISLRAVPISEAERGEIACFLDSVGGCTQCELLNSNLKCPQWSRADVTKVIQTQAKGAASLAAIFIIYAVSAFRFGFVLRKHVTTYQIDYV